MNKTVYYVPIHCYRHFPSMGDLKDGIISAVLRGQPIKAYNTYEEASDATWDMRFDDDACGIYKVTFDNGDLTAIHLTTPFPENEDNFSYSWVKEEYFNKLFKNCS